MFTIADVMFAPIVSRIIYGLSEDDIVVQYSNAIQVLPSYQEWEEAQKPKHGMWRKMKLMTLIFEAYLGGEVRACFIHIESFTMLYLFVLSHYSCRKVAPPD